VEHDEREVESKRVETREIDRSAREKERKREREKERMKNEE
jgi:hypothetical protein